MYIVSSKEKMQKKNRKVIYYTCHYLPCTVAYSSMYVSLIDDVLELNVIEGEDLPSKGYERVHHGSPILDPRLYPLCDFCLEAPGSPRISQDLQVHGRFEIFEII